MRDSSKDKIQGTANERKGKLKEKVGKATNDPDLEAQGTGDKVAGKVQKTIGDIRQNGQKRSQSIFALALSSIAPQANCDTISGRVGNAELIC
jgi:uncharacterized protein YjbJ (UPF0337 family)